MVLNLSICNNECVFRMVNDFWDTLYLYYVFIYTFSERIVFKLHLSKNMASKPAVILTICLINLSACAASLTTTDLSNVIPTFPPNGKTNTATGTITTKVQTTETGTTGSGPQHDKTTNTTNEDDGKHNEDEHENGHSSIKLVPIHFKHVKYPLVFTIVVLLAGLSKLGFHFSHFLSSKIPESWLVSKNLIHSFYVG